MKVRIPGRDKLTSKMKKAAVDASIEELRGLMPKVVCNVEAIILWQLHEQFGFGKKRLLQFYNATSGMIDGMLDYYCYDTDEDAIWICERKLREQIGIDLANLKSPFSVNIKVK